MAGPSVPKEPIVDALVEEWGVIADLVDGLSPDEWNRPTNLPGWTVADNVAHMVGTERSLAGDPMPEAAEEVGKREHIRNDIGASNEHWVEHYRSSSRDEVVGEFRRITAARADALRAMSQEDFDADSWTPAGQANYGRFMRIRLFDCWMHEQDIRDALGRPGHEEGHCAEGALDEVVTALGYIVGKRGSAPEGARVAIDLIGGVRRTINVAVDGRAAVVDQLPGPATVRLTLPFGLFMRLAGGRVAPSARLGEVDISGDIELGRRLVENLAYTI